MNAEEFRESQISSPLFHDDGEYLPATLSVFPTFGSDISDEPGKHIVHRHGWPSSGNSFTDLDGWQSLNQSHFEGVECPMNEETIAMQYSFTDLAIIDDDPSVQRQSIQFESTPQASSPISTNSTKHRSDEAKRPVTESKARTRRSSVNPYLETLNPYGRGGKPRCDRCRSQRQRVRSQSASH